MAAKTEPKLRVVWLCPKRRRGRNDGYCGGAMPRDDVAPDTVKIRLTGVGKRFATRDREVQALQPIDLTVRDHEFVALVGPSGCGKSTILNLVAGLLAPSEGRIWYDGEPVNGLNRNVGYMTQKDTLLPWRSAADNVRIALELKCRSVPRAEANARVRQLLLALVVNLEIAGLQIGHGAAVAIFHHHADLHQLRVHMQCGGRLGRLGEEANHRKQSQGQSISDRSFKGHERALQI
jgi:ABC-type glutathione transport system ATPase component